MENNKKTNAKETSKEVIQKRSKTRKKDNTRKEGLKREKLQKENVKKENLKPTVVRRGRKAIAKVPEKALATVVENFSFKILFGSSLIFFVIIKSQSQKVILI